MKSGLFAALILSFALAWTPNARAQKPSDIVFSTDTLKFGTVVLKDSKTLLLTITNKGGTPINFYGWSSPATVDYTAGIGVPVPTLDPDSTINIAVTFSPKAPTPNHLHQDSIVLHFASLPLIPVILIGYDHVPIWDTLAIDDTFLGFAGRRITIVQRLVAPLTGMLDSVYSFTESIHYDPAILNILSVAPAAATDGWTMSHLEWTPGITRITGFWSDHAMRGAGPVLLLNFTINRDAPLFAQSYFEQDSIAFGRGFEPLMTSTPGRATIIDECVPIATDRASLTTMIAQNTPNPVREQTVFHYQVGPSPGGVTPVRIDLYDMRGERAATVVDETKSPGAYSAFYDATQLAPGVYSCIFEAGPYRVVRKVVVVH